jgi:hypothetical protein
VSNLVPNPSFETDLTGWVATGTGSVARVTSEPAFDGSAVATLTIGSTGQAALTNNVTGFRAPVVAGQTYSAGLRAKWRTGTPKNLHCDVVWYDASNNTIPPASTGVSSISSTSYQQWKIENVTAPAGAVTAALRGTTATNATTGDVIDFDGFQLNEGAVLEPYSGGDTPAPQGLPLNYFLSGVAVGTAVTTAVAGSGDSAPTLVKGTPSVQEAGAPWTARNPVLWFPENEELTSLHWTHDATFTMAGRFRQYRSDYPAGTEPYGVLFTAASGSTVRWRVALSIAGRILIHTAGGVLLASGSVVLPTSRWLHYEWTSDASAGRVTVRVYDWATRQLLEQVSGTGWSGAIDNTILGNTLVGMSTPTRVVWDDITVTAGTSAPVWPESSGDATPEVRVTVAGEKRTGRIKSLWRYEPGLGEFRPRDVIGAHLFGFGGGGGGPVDPIPSGVFPADGALIGLYVGGNDLSTPAAIATEAGRKMAVTKCYYDLASATVPVTLQRNQANIDGTMIHVCLALNCNQGATHNSRLPAPAHPDLPTKKGWTYDQVTSGAMDTYFRWLATQLKAINRPFTFDINHEPENQQNGVGRTEAFSAPNWYTNRANTTEAFRQRVLREFANANRHIKAIFDEEGLTNCLWTMTYASLGSNGAAYDSWVYEALYPGDDVVDVVAWDPYDSGNSKTPLQTFQQGYNMLKNGLLDTAPFYPGTQAKNKPFMLGEFGTRVGNNTYVRNWLLGVDDALRSLPQIKTATYWSSSLGSTSYVVHTAGSANRAAFVDLLQEPFVDVMAPG